MKTLEKRLLSQKTVCNETIDNDINDDIWFTGKMKKNREILK